MIFAIIWGILIFVRFLGFAGVPEHFSEWVVSLPVPRVVIMLGILFVYLVLGCFMDAIGMMLLTLPVFYPAVIKLGYDPIWFGIIVVKMCGRVPADAADRPQLLRGGGGAARHSAGRRVPRRDAVRDRRLHGHRHLPRLAGDHHLAARPDDELSKIASSPQTRQHRSTADGVLSGSIGP